MFLHLQDREWGTIYLIPANSLMAKVIGECNLMKRPWRVDVAIIYVVVVAAAAIAALHKRDCVNVDELAHDVCGTLYIACYIAGFRPYSFVMYVYEREETGTGGEWRKQTHAADPGHTAGQRKNHSIYGDCFKVEKNTKKVKCGRTTIAH